MTTGVAQHAKDAMGRAYGVLRRRYEAWSYHTRDVFDVEGGNEKIRRVLIAGQPSAIGKMGSVEMLAVRQYLRTRSWRDHDAVWRRLTKDLYVNAGVFPPVTAVFEDWSEAFLRTLREMAILGVWFHAGESKIVRAYCDAASLVPIRSLEPFYSKQPWSAALAGKRVLVLHPFVDTIRAQYARRNDIWPGRQDLLPDFTLLTIRVPVSDGLQRSPFPSWFDTLRALQQSMDDEPFDVAIVGAGAYSLPLVTHARRLGAIGIHMGGGTQVLFGVRGRRWDAHPVISNFYNDAWVRPLPSDTPDTYHRVEHGGYW